MTVTIEVEIMRNGEEYEIDELEKRVKAILGKEFYKGMTKKALSKYREIFCGRSFIFLVPEARRNMKN